jgi:hypothetical protein
VVKQRGATESLYFYHLRNASGDNGGRKSLLPLKNTMCLQQSFLSQKHFRDEIGAGIRPLTNAAQYAEREIRPLGAGDAASSWRKSYRLRNGTYPVKAPLGSRPDDDPLVRADRILQSENSAVAQTRGLDE